MMMNSANRIELNSGFECIRSTISENKVCLGYEIMDYAFMNMDGLFSPEGKLQKKATVQSHLSNTFTPFRLDLLWPKEVV
jgi:hypothetical protein